MRITFVLPGYPWKPVGGYRVVYEYANELTKRGHEVTVIHPRKLRQRSLEPPSFYQKVRHIAASIRNIFLKPRVTWQYLDERVRMLYVPEPTARYVPDGDVVFATAWQTAEYVNEYPDSKGRKFYLIQHYEIWSGPKERVDATWLFPMKKVVIAKWLYELGLELGVQGGEMCHIPNGIDLKKFRVTRPIESRPKRVAMLYSPLEWKGFADGLRALEIAHEECPDFRAVLFGTSPRKPNIIQDWIDYISSPPQEILVTEIYNNSSIYLCPSWTEGWGLPGAEAIACGCTLVSTDNGGVRDYAVNYQTALLSPPRKPEALANNLIRILGDEKMRIRLGRAGYENIQRFTWKRATDLLVNFICS